MTGWLIDTLLYTGILIAVVLVLRRPAGRFFGPQIAYGLWALPFLRLLLPPVVLPAEFAPAPVAAPLPPTEFVPVAFEAPIEPVALPDFAPVAAPPPPAVAPIYPLIRDKAGWSPRAPKMPAVHPARLVAGL